MKTDNVPGFPGYYISKRGRVFSRVEFAYDTGIEVVGESTLNLGMRLNLI